jgi:hypothetical protein
MMSAKLVRARFEILAICSKPGGVVPDDALLRMEARNESRSSLANNWSMGRVLSMFMEAIPLRIGVRSAAAEKVKVPVSAPAPRVTEGPRSSNLRLAKSFTQRDKDRFQNEAFEFIARFFENSLAELGQRNPGIEGDFRRVDANRFFATIYQDGKDVAKATIYMGGDSFGRGINYVQGHTIAGNTINESLTVDADDQSIYLKTMGMLSYGQDDRKLSPEGGAELYWENLIRPLQERW